MIKKEYYKIKIHEQVIGHEKIKKKLNHQIMVEDGRDNICI